MKRLGLKTVCVLLGIWLLLPVLIVVPLSFTAKRSYVFPPTDFSTRWYESFLTDPNWVQVTYNSVIISDRKSVV